MLTHSSTHADLLPRLTGRVVKGRRTAPTVAAGSAGEPERAPERDDCNGVQGDGWRCAMRSIRRSRTGHTLYRTDTGRSHVASLTGSRVTRSGDFRAARPAAWATPGDEWGRSSASRLDRGASYGLRSRSVVESAGGQT